MHGMLYIMQTSADHLKARVGPAAGAAAAARGRHQAQAARRCGDAPQPTWVCRVELVKYTVGYIDLQLVQEEELH